MSIRAKITLLVLLVGLSEAVLLGVIGYNSVSSVSRNAAELRRIGSAIEGTRALNVSLTRLSDPAEFLMGNEPGAVDRFSAHMNDLESLLSTCAATSCHGYEKRPPKMAAELRQNLRSIRAAGVQILSSRRVTDESPPLAKWTETVDGPTRRVTRATERMGETLTMKAQELEISSRKTERAALFLVTATTLFCIFLAVAICRPMARGITQPLESLAEQSRRISDGDLMQRAEETGPRETVLLARSFNRMLEDLAGHRDELLAHKTHLEREVEEQIAELRQKDEELRRSEQSAGIGLVAGAVAHDLNNPITNILLNAESLIESLPPSGQGRDIATDIMKDASRCREIAYEIRALGRDTELELVPCQIDKLVHEAVRHLRFKWELRKIAVKCEFGEDGLEFRCNPPRVLQLLVNLLSNAIDASPDRSEVCVRTRSENDKFILEVEDHGQGIPPDRRALLFKLFFTTKLHGTGLGLAISKRIVQQHGGMIECQTRTLEEAQEAGFAGPGTVFRVVLPQSA